LETIFIIPERRTVRQGALPAKRHIRKELCLGKPEWLVNHGEKWEKTVLYLAFKVSKIGFKENENHCIA
jgi:hypothetical protein